jgi:hypothetical protein
MRILYTIALVAVIGFSFIACDDGGGDDGTGTTTTTPVTVTGVTLNKNSVVLAVEGTETLTASVEPADATNKSVTWSSSDDTVATVTANGANVVVTAVTAGSATITVTTQDGSKTAQCAVSVHDGTFEYPIPLTVDTWENGNLPENGEQWFTFTATADTQYIHASFGTLTTLYVQVYSSSDTTVGTQTYLYSSTKSISRTVSTGQTYYIKVTPYGSGSGGISGTYKIAFNTGFVPPGVIPTALTVDTWADGNLPENGEQWFTFTATADTQYIHVYFDILTSLYVQVYDSSGATVGTATSLTNSSTNKYISRTVLTEQTYYIKVTPFGSGSGTYQIGFNTGVIPPGIPLTLNTWADVNLSRYGEQWFTFTATADPQYIHASFGTLTDLYVQVYDSSGAPVGDRTNLWSSTKYISRTVSTGQTYYIKVTPYSSSYSGTYQIGFTESIVPPGAIPLTLNTWADGNLPVNGEQWFTFTATASTQYIHASFGTLTNLYVQVYNSSGATVGSRTNLNSTNEYISRTVSTGQTYYIRVTPYSSSYSGTYQIGFNTDFVPPGGVIPLTLNTWADGSLPVSGEQWFTFTAAASTQYIHTSFGTLTNLYVQVYNSSGNTVNSQSNLTSSSTNKYISRTVSTGQTYYIRVKPYSSSYSGTYQIGFNTDFVPPGGVIPLTLNTWADGNLSANGEQWFTFTATASPQYIRVSFGTSTNLYVQVYDSSGAKVGSITLLSTSSSSSDKSISQTVSTGQTYYIRVTPYYVYSGTYQIRFTESFIPPGVTPTALTFNTWENGNLPANGEQWFTFTATADTQYIHASFGTLTGLWVQVYASSGATVGNQIGWDNPSTDEYFSWAVSTGQTYYIRVTPYMDYSGTYKIAFNTSTTAPGN